MYEDILKTIHDNNERLLELEPIDFATNEEIDKLLAKMISIINNQYEIMKKQEESIKAIQLSSNQSSMYSRVSILIAVVAIAVAIVIGMR